MLALSRYWVVLFTIYYVSYIHILYSSNRTTIKVVGVGLGRKWRLNSVQDCQGASVNPSLLVLAHRPFTPGNRVHTYYIVLVVLLCMQYYYPVHSRYMVLSICCSGYPPYAAERYTVARASRAVNGRFLHQLYCEADAASLLIACTTTMYVCSVLGSTSVCATKQFSPLSFGRLLVNLRSSAHNVRKSDRCYVWPQISFGEATFLAAKNFWTKP